MLLAVGSVLIATGAGRVTAAEKTFTRIHGAEILQSTSQGFSDIGDAGGHGANVRRLAEKGILAGTECAPAKFCPKEPVQRWVMAVWLVRAVDETEPETVDSSRFADVEVGQWWTPYVERLADLGITRGCSTEPVRFCPTDPVTRQEMASFLVRAFHLEPESGNRFADVAESNSHLANINALAASGITVGCATEPARYCPTEETTRAEMATFLARALGIDRKTPTQDTDQDPILADPELCRPKGTEYTTAGFPLPKWAVPSTGTVRVAVLFLDFPDAPAAISTHHEAELVLTPTEKYLEKMSYQKLDVEFVALHRWLRSAHKSDHYLRAGIGGKTEFQYEIDEEAVRLADSEFDFTGYEALITVMPSSHFWGGNALGTVETDEGSISTLRLNTFPLTESVHRWVLTGAHEFAHNLGLLDLYPYDPTLHEPPIAPEGERWAYLRFGLMSMWAHFRTAENDPRLAYDWRFADGSTATAYDYHLEAEEMLAWSRWQLGWLEPSQIRCLSGPQTETTVLLNPVASPGDGTAMVAISLSDSEAIVIESRRKLGHDAGEESLWPDGARATYPALAEEGVLVYTVNASIESGQLPLKVTGDSGNGQVDEYPVLTVGESVTVKGYTITLHSSTHHTDTVTINNTDSNE